MRDFTSDMKRVSNDLVFLDSTEDLLKEAMIVFKKNDFDGYQASVLTLV